MLSGSGLTPVWGQLQAVPCYVMRRQAWCRARGTQARREEVLLSDTAIRISGCLAT